MSIFDPEVGDSIVIDDGTYSFAEHPNAPGIVHSQVGRFGVVYHIFKENDEFALKQFHLELRNPEIATRNIQISQLHGITGLRAINDREILLPNYPITKAYPDLLYSIKMPWIKGRVWSNYLEKKIPLSALDCLNFARSLASIISDLERQGIAHCDLSSGNIVFEGDKNQHYQVQLIDIEDIFARNFAPPKYKLLGSPGYSPKWISNNQNGAYCLEGDRYAGAILFAEILCWQFPDVRQLTYDGTSYFDPKEIAIECERYQLIKNRLGEIDLRLARLFDKVWNSKSLQNCPKLAEWKEVIDDIRIPSLVVFPTILDFGAIDLSSLTFRSPTRQLNLSNTGNMPVIGEIITDPCISISSAQKFSLNPGEKLSITANLKNVFSKPSTSDVSHKLTCMKVSTNCGDFDITALFSLTFPIMGVDKAKVNFGTLDLSSNLSDAPKAKISISNKGGGLLSAKINTKNKWVGVSQSSISLNKGQSVDIWITLSREAPIPQNGEKYIFSDWIQIISNGGNQNITGEYIVKRSKLPFWIAWLILNMGGFFVAFWGIDKLFGTLDLYTFIILAGIILGGIQWFALRKKIKNPIRWFFASALGFPAGFLINIWFGNPFHFPIEALNTFLSGVIIGFLPGLLQWMVLRNKFNHSGRLIFSSSVGYAIGLLLAQFTTGVLVDPIPVLFIGISYGLFVGLTLEAILPGLPRRTEQISFVNLHANSWSEFFKKLFLWALLGGIAGSLFGAVFGLLSFALRGGGPWSVGALINGGVDGLVVGGLISIIGASGQSNKFPTRKIILLSIVIGLILVGFWPLAGVITNGLISLAIFGGCSIYIADTFMKKQVIDKVPTRSIFYFVVLLPVYGLGVAISVIVCLRGDPIHGALWIGLSGLALSLFTSATYLLSKK